MRLVLAAGVLLVTAASRGCGQSTPYEPCAGKACGDACRVCAPDATDCVETAVVKACDPAGTCSPAGTFACGVTGACAGKACGASCVWDPPCRSATPPCMMPSYVGHCSADGACVAGAFAGCDPDLACVGKICGQPCDRCGGACMNPVATACDYAGRCTVVSPWLCYDPCSGKACGAQCHSCPPDSSDCVEAALYTVCRADGVCDASTSGLTCP